MSYQMTPVGPLGIDAFLSSVNRINTSIQILPTDITSLEQLHGASLRNPDLSSSSYQQVRSQISSIQASVTTSIREITNQISDLATDAGNTTNDYRGEKLNHVKNLRNKLRLQVDSFQQMENRVERSNRDALERQYAIVRPDASRDEVAAAVDQGLADRDDIFAQAIMQSSRRGQASSTLQAVRDRQQELQRLAETMQQLNELFQQMAQLVDAQDHMVKHVETQAEQVEQDYRGANKHLDTGIKHAKLRRKWKWYCLWICVAIIAILALILGIYFGVIYPRQRDTVKVTTGV